MNKIFLCLFITAFAECLGQDYVNNNLDCVYGKRSYHGPDDAQASVRVTSHDNMIEVLVDLKDDRVFFSDELIKSDHIELWFAIDTLSRNYILDGEVYENSVGEAVSVESFLSYKAHIRSDSDPPPPQDGNESEQALDGNDSKPELVSDFTGMVHWGIDLKNKTATLFDTSRYYFLTPAGSLSKFITVKSTGASSYSILIKPEALGFSARNIISSLHMMADVFDADGPNDLSVLSTSVHRMWGKRNSFTDLKLSSPLTIGENLNPDEVIEGGVNFFNDGRWDYYYSSSTSTDLRDPFCALTYLPLTYDEQVQTLNDSSKVYIRDYQLERFVVYPEMIRKVKFKSWSFECYDKACSGEVDGPAAPDITIEIVKNKKWMNLTIELTASSTIISSSESHPS
jgi:hypothetical protein